MSVSTDNAVKALMLMRRAKTKDLTLETTKTKNFRDAIFMRDLSIRLTDTHSILETYCKVLLDCDATKLDKRSSIANVFGTIVPFISLASTFLSDTSTKFSPIRGSAYVHNRLEKEQRNIDKLERINTLIGVHSKVGSPKKKKQRTNITTPPR